MTTLRRSAPRLLVESALIVFSILLAFALNGWWELRQQRQLAERALASFEQELRRNSARLQEVMPYHLRLREQFAELSGAGAIRSIDDLHRIEGFAGVRRAFLTTTAWRTSLATGALTHIDYELVEALSNVYTLQERFTETSRSDFLLGPGAWTEANIGSTIFTVVLYLGDVTAGAQELMEAYHAVLQRLESRRRR